MTEASAGSAPADPRRESLRERLAYLGFATMERLAMSLPERAGGALFELAGLLAWRLLARPRRTVERNLSQVLGEPLGSTVLEAAGNEVFRSYARYWFESFHIRVLPDEAVLNRFRMEGREHIDRAVEEGRGAVLALPHLGNWDVAGHWLHLNGYRMVAVAEQLRPRALYDLFYRHRVALGMQIVPLAGRRALGEELARRLANNELLTLVADRALSGRGVDVEMFGATRPLPPGPAALSLSTGSPLLPAANYHSDGGWLCVIRPPISIEPTGDRRADVASLTRMLAAEFERGIAAAPTQWHMLQPAWPTGGSGGVARPRRGGEE
ncbi:MAG: phosphatidylinositol mannoside acyltransferase [Actinomycetota bacterium]